MSSAPPLDIRPEIAAALKAGKPVVGLGSSAVGHTLPWPANVEAVHLAEAAVREEGGVLAVLAVWHGRLTVGLTSAEVEALARGASNLRASRRDLPMAVVHGLTAGTTVAASMYIASQAGIRLLATGAIGGVARGNNNSWDVSADLVELSRTPVAVVSGARSVLSLTATGEILESYGVPVIGFGTDMLPPFYLRVGGHPASARANTPAEAAALLTSHWSMDGAGAVLAQPTPAAVALSPDELHPALQAVERQAMEANVRGKDLSPFLMSRLNRLTGGKALRAYQAILAANARLAAKVAAAQVPASKVDAGAAPLPAKVM